MKVRVGAFVFRRRAVVAVTALAVALAVPASLPAGLAGAATSNRPRAADTVRATPPASSSTGDIYFVSGGYIERRPVAGGTPHRVVKVGNVSVVGMAILSDRLFWVTSAGAHDALSYVGLPGSSQVHKLVSNLPFPVGLVAVDGWLYWADEDAIGRVRPDGAHVSRRFLALPPQRGGGVADGLATDGRHLFFSRCQDSAVGRVDANGHEVHLSFIQLGKGACPQGLAVGNDHVYWAELGIGSGSSGYVGRATLQGTDGNDEWLNVHTSEGPFDVAADDTNVYWDWGGVAESPMHVGRASVDRAGFHRSILLGKGAFLLTSVGANS